MALEVPIIWLTEIGHGKGMSESVNIVSKLARLQHHHQRIETTEFEPFYGNRTMQFKKGTLISDVV